MAILSAAAAKLKTARYHLAQLEASDDLAVQRYHLEAFLGAARSAVIKLRDAQPAYKLWIDGWVSNLSPADLSVWRFMAKQRNEDVHGGGIATDEAIEERLVMKRMQSGPNTPMVAQLLAMGLYESEATIGVPVLMFQINGAKRIAREVCQDYLRLLDRCIADFQVAFP